MHREAMRLKKVAIYSLKGGTGRTTISANLGAELTRRGVPCLLVDTDPQNTLGLHFGMEMGERFGMALPGGSYADFEAYRRRNTTKVAHVPFGHLTPDEVLDIQDERQLAGEWLSSCLSRYVPPETELILVDMPPGFDRWAVRALASVDLVLVVLQADGASYATTPMVEELLLDRAPDTVAYLINQVDTRHALSRDVRDSLGNLLGERLLPFVVPYDEALRESLAQQRVLLEHAPDSRAASSIAKLADWLLAQLDQLDRLDDIDDEVTGD